MKLVKVSGQPAFRYTCVRCQKVGEVGLTSPNYRGEVEKRADVFADLEGKPFVDYYCEKCASELRAAQGALR